MNPAASIHIEMTVRKSRKHALIALFLALLIPLFAIWAVVEGNKLRELGRQSLGNAVIAIAVAIFVLRLLFYWNP